LSIFEMYGIYFCANQSNYYTRKLAITKAANSIVLTATISSLLSNGK